MERCWLMVQGKSPFIRKGLQINTLEIRINKGGSKSEIFTESERSFISLVRLEVKRRGEREFMLLTTKRAWTGQEAG